MQAVKFSTDLDQELDETRRNKSASGLLARSRNIILSVFIRASLQMHNRWGDLISLSVIGHIRALPGDTVEKYKILSLTGVGNTTNPYGAAINPENK